MTTTDKREAAGRRGRRPDCRETGVTSVTATAAEVGLTGISRAEGMPAVEPQCVVSSGNEPAFSAATECAAADDFTDADAGAGVITGVGVTPNSGSPADRPEHEADKGQRDGEATPGLGPMSPALTASRIPTGQNAKIVELVSRAEGAGIDELATATGWKRHTVRAALTRLRQAGFTVELRTVDDDHRAYRHITGAEASS